MDPQSYEQRLKDAEKVANFRTKCAVKSKVTQFIAQFTAQQTSRQEFSSAAVSDLPKFCAVVRYFEALKNEFKSGKLFMLMSRWFAK